MVDISKILRKAYYDALNSQISLTSIVPVYDRVPNKQDYPFVHISGVDLNDSPRAKNAMLVEARIEISIITGYQGDFGTKEDAESLSSQICEIIYPLDVSSYLQLDSQGKLLTTRLENTMTNEVSIETHYIIEKKIVFSHKIILT